MRASRPCGVVGVITMKMMMSTRSTSIRGTMFGSDIEPLFPPTAIPIKNSLNAPQLVRAAGCAWWRRRRRSALLILLGQQTEVIDASRANFVHGLHHIAIFRASIGPNEHGLVEAVGDLVFYGSGDLGKLDLLAAQVEATVALDSENDRVILVGVLHVFGVVDLGHVHRHAFL